MLEAFLARFPVSVMVSGFFTQGWARDELAQ